MTGHAVDLPGGAHIEYLEVGSGPPVVYFHGASGVLRNAAFMPALAERYRMLAPSRPGYDGSTGTCAAAREEAEVMAEFIHCVVDGPVHLIAESAGAAAGCWLAILQPSLVQSLTLVSPTAFAEPSHDSAELKERLPEIAAPTLVLCGTADEVVPPESGQIYQHSIPNSYRMLIYGAAHSLPVSACSRFVSLVTDFIERGDRFVVAEPA